MTTLNPVRLIAHRGASATYPEHTRAAYQQAVFDGADGIETDIRLTQDGALVCWHDDTLDRTGGVQGRVRYASLATLRDLDLLRGVEIPEMLGAPSQQLMTLQDLIALMVDADRPLLLAIELKPDPGDEMELVDTTLAALNAAGWDPQTGELGNLHISLMCFDLQSVQLLLPYVHPSLVMILTEPDDPEPAPAFDLVELTPVNAGPGIEWVREEPFRVVRWVESGKTVRIWTVDEPEDLDFCLLLGVREITTNRPAALRRALRAHEEVEPVTESISLGSLAAAMAAEPAR